MTTIAPTSSASLAQGALFDMDRASIFLDLDGTLAPLADAPGEVGPDPLRTQILTQLADRLDRRRPRGGWTASTMCMPGCRPVWRAQRTWAASADEPSDRRIQSHPPTDQGAGTTGGLAMALAAALREYSGVWFGWSGQTTERFSGQIAMQKIGGVTVAAVDLEDQDRQEYYNGDANRTLWPPFHYRIDLTSYERSFDEGYARVNARFAQTLAPLIGPDDFVWIHDYHLIPLGRELRRLGIANRLGFFLHIPWPARRLLTTLPKHRELVRSLFDYDLVGFQTEDSLGAFEDYVVQEAGGAVTPDGAATAFGRATRLGAFPIGLDTADFVEAAKSPEAAQAHARMVESLAGRRMILGVDRLDYSKASRSVCWPTSNSWPTTPHSSKSSS